MVEKKPRVVNPAKPVSPEDQALLDKLEDEAARLVAQ